MRTTHAHTLVPTLAIASMLVSLRASAQQQAQPWVVQPQAPQQQQPVLGQQPVQQPQQAPVQQAPAAPVQQPWQGQAPMQQPMPQQQQPWQQQPMPQQQQPWQQQPMPQQQPQSQGWVAPFPQQPPMPAPAAPTPASKRKRSEFEMSYLYGAAGAYGVGTGIWMDAVFKWTEPSIAIMPPVILGAGAVVGTYLWDRNTTLHRGVPAATSLGLTLGLAEGAAISLTQAQHSPVGSEWKFSTSSTVSWLAMTGGGVGGYFWGEYFRPDPRSIALIGTGSAMGTLSGALVGGGATGTNFKEGDFKDGATTGSLVGLNVGMVGSAVLSTLWTPSWKTTQYIWAGYGVGVAASTMAFIPTLASDGDNQKVLVLSGIMGLAGASVAGALTADLKDDDDTSVTRSGNTFHVNFGASPQKGGGVLTAVGTF